MKYHVTINGTNGKQIKTWGVLPVLSTTKILDGIYDPDGKVLRLYLDSVSEQYRDVQIQNPKNLKYEVQKRKMDIYYEFVMEEKDIPFFLENYVENNFNIQALIHTDSNIDLNNEQKIAKA